MRLNILDSLELLHFKNHRRAYPIHYHESYCISLIHQGVFGENESIAPKGSIVISHPYEIHQNNVIENISTTYSTFYVSPDLINFISPFEQTSFSHKVIEDPLVYRQLDASLQVLDQKKKSSLNFQKAFYQSISRLIDFHGIDQPYLLKESSALLDEVKQFIAHRLHAKIDLNGLARIVGMSKFKFIRWFKLHVGITPFEYILLKRVGCGKKLIQQGLPLVDVSLNSGFYDQSHFSNYFKKYVGMSPNVYKRSCNILQDF